MSPNVPLLRQTMAQIEAHPEQWDQGSWTKELTCGTAYCFAGWAAVLSGARFAKNAYSQEFRSCVIPPGRILPVDVADYAADLLGVEHYETERSDEDNYVHLFNGGNDLDDLRQIVDELCADAEVTE